MTFTWAGVSKRSILESSSDELIFPPVRPGTVEEIHNQSIKSRWVKPIHAWYLVTHGVHQVRSFLVSQLRQELLGKHEDLSLVDSSELSVTLQVFFIKSLHTKKTTQEELCSDCLNNRVKYLKARVEETAEEGMIDLFHDFRSRFLRVVLSNQWRQFVNIECVLSANTPTISCIWSTV